MRMRIICEVARTGQLGGYRVPTHMQLEAILSRNSTAVFITTAQVVNHFEGHRAMLIPSWFIRCGGSTVVSGHYSGHHQGGCVKEHMFCLLFECGVSLSGQSCRPPSIGRHTRWPWFFF
mmetsp:Transcript_14561/g.40005  ORF Transcript_14561/g.40005 Transcript_14561/m.40005 type:complete len:119 (+) Transcript_14561:1004-1360(+)